MVAKVCAMVALTAGRKVGMLDIREVLKFLSPCNDTVIAGYLTSITAEIHTYADFEACMIAKYGKHNAK